MTNAVYPFCAVIGQDLQKRALLLCAIDPGIGGVLVQGPRGVAKTTLARALGELLPGRFVELPLGATEERVTGTLNLESALRDARVEFMPGLLARAHEGLLYVDEINLLPDALVDLLLDAAATGQNVIERDGISHSHAARLVLIGTMNPEEGELRPQLIDRFGLSANADNDILPEERAEIVSRRLDFDRDPETFRARFAAEQAALIERCRAARERAAKITLGGPALTAVTERCYAAGVEGVRADLAMLRAARAHAAWQGRVEITLDDVEAVAELALAHRRRAGKPEPPTSRSGGATPAGSAGGSGAAAGSGGVARRQSAAPGCSPRLDQQAGGPAAVEQSAKSTGNGAHAAGVADRGGALAAVPVRASPTPKLPSWLIATRGRRQEARRRGAAQLNAARGVRGAACGAQTGQAAIDWFATLATSRHPRRHDIRYRARRAASQQLWILAVDCSSSMLRGAALAAAKGAAHALEASALRAGAHVALLSFRGPDARVEVTSSAGRYALDRAIDELGAGGGTPLRRALLAAFELCAQRRWRSPAVVKKLVLLTDARSRESMADLPRAPTNLELIVIDCESSQLRLGRAPALAVALGGRCLHVDALR
jgi:magnesium chelatase subunit D